MKINRLFPVAIVAAVAFFSLGGPAMADMLTPKEILGGLLYSDESLSLNKNQSCLTCHNPLVGWVDPDNTRDPMNSVVSTGSDGTSLGGREAPTAAYMSFSPPFFWDDSVEGEELYIGGQFWDGRASTLADQAKGPFLNLKEMAMPNKAAVVNAVKKAFYAPIFKLVYGRNAFTNVDTAYDNIADAIAAFESTSILNSFSSKYDAFLAGKAKLSAKEKRGLALYEGKAQCNACHPNEDTRALFTDYSYDNLGMPKSLNSQLVDNPIDYGLGAREGLLYCTQYIDMDDGLGGLVSICESEAGKFKVPTLRNIAVTAPYGHNGYFATLRDIVHFYNTRDVEIWPDPEVNMNVNDGELGNLGLSAAEEDDLVAFLKTLTDGYR